MVADIDTEGLSFHVTLAVANRTASGDELLEALKAKADAERDRRERLFIVVVPQEGGDGSAARRARTRLTLVLGRLRDAGLTAAGMIGDPDPYTAIMNALQYFRVDDIVISTFAETKSGWLRADLIERVRRATGKPVEHVVHRRPVAAEPPPRRADGSRLDRPRRAPRPAARAPLLAGRTRRRSGCCFSSSPR